MTFAVPAQQLSRPSVPLCSQVGFRKGTTQPFGPRTQLELALTGVSLLLAALLLGCLVALGLQSHTGRWVQACHPPTKP